MQIDKNALWKATKFACLPTLSLLVLVFVGFLNIPATLAFIFGNTVAAVILRFICLISEAYLIYYMYKIYARENILNSKNPLENSLRTRDAHRRDYVHSLNPYWTDSIDYSYTVHNTYDDNIVIVERKKND